MLRAVHHGDPATETAHHLGQLHARRPGARLPVLVPNRKGFERARAADVREIAVFTAASETELRQVYSQLGEQIGYEVRKVDTSRPWLAGGALLLVVGVGAGIGLGRRLP